MIFLQDKYIHSQTYDILQHANEAKIAVAYWGIDAIRRLGLSNMNRSSIQVICDLRSGCCNPAELEKLIKIAKVKRIDSFHAKVFWTPNGAIVGSANASSNGLCEEGKDFFGNIEACVFIDNKKILSDIRKWFDIHWDSSKAINVDRNEIDLARCLWRSRRNYPRLQIDPSTILSKLDFDRRWFNGRNIRLYFYESEDASADAHRAFDQEKHLRYSKDELRNYIEEYDSPPFYEDVEGLEAGDYVIDYNLYDGRIEYDGIWQVKTTNPYVAKEDGGKITLLDRVDTALGLTFPADEQIRLKERIIEYRKARQAKNLDWNIDKPLDKLPKVLYRPGIGPTT